MEHNSFLVVKEIFRLLSQYRKFIIVFIKSSYWYTSSPHSYTYCLKIHFSNIVQLHFLFLLLSIYNWSVVCIPLISVLRATFLVSSFSLLLNTVTGLLEERTLAIIKLFAMKLYPASCFYLCLSTLFVLTSSITLAGWVCLFVCHQCYFACQD